MKRKKYNLYIMFLIAVILGCHSKVYAYAEEYPTGVIALDEEEEEAFLNSIPKVEEVRLNEQALEYIEAQLASTGQLHRAGLPTDIETVEKGEEVLTDGGTLDDTVRTASAAEAGTSADVRTLVNSVTRCDVSEKNTFLPIGDQGNTGSCVSWSAGYYMTTNNIANVRGLDAKNNKKYCISPRWIHNLIKNYDQKDAGSNIAYALPLLMKQGAPYWDVFGGQTKEDNFKSWNPEVNVWKKALDNRLKGYSSISILNEEGEVDLTNLKAVLLNGYVVSFSSTFDDEISQVAWRISDTAIITPADRKNQKISLAMKWANKENKEKTAGHQMTIVGWDDTIQIDYNGDGVADSQGALKIANSWGADWGNNGFFWLAYDALGTASKVSGSHTTNRVAAIDSYRVYLAEPRVSYTPLILAELTLETNSRKELGIKLDISQSNSESISAKARYIYQHLNEGMARNKRLPFYFKNYAPSTEVHDYDFYGVGIGPTIRTSATFLIDLTDWVTQYYCASSNGLNVDSKVRMHFQIEDINLDGYSSALTNVKIIDNINGTSWSKSVNLVVDGSIEHTWVDFDVAHKVITSDKVLSLRFNYPIRQTTIDNEIKMQKTGSAIYNPTKTVSSDRKTITLSPPDGGYQSGSYYTLNLGGLRTDGGNTLSSNSSIGFYIQ